MPFWMSTAHLRLTVRPTLREARHEPGVNGARQNWVNHPLKAKRFPLEMAISCRQRRFGFSLGAGRFSQSPTQSLWSQKIKLLQHKFATAAFALSVDSPMNAASAAERQSFVLAIQQVDLLLEGRRR